MAYAIDFSTIRFVSPSALVSERLSRYIEDSFPEGTAVRVQVLEGRVEIESGGDEKLGISVFNRIYTYLCHLLQSSKAPKQFITSNSTSYTQWDNIYKSLDRQSGLFGRITRAFSVFDQVLSQYPLDKLSISFNGGKDCMVMLHLLHHFFIQKNINHDNKAFRMSGLYIRHMRSFPEMDEFARETARKYNLDLIEYQLDMKLALEQFIVRTHSRAIFMGTRRTDPFSSHLSTHTLTDKEHGWPEIMRIHPILDWSYEEVWEYLDLFQVDTCILYEFGYTSLGGLENTMPNPHLAIGSDEELETAFSEAKSAGVGFYHARYLKDINGQQERTGRFK